MRFPPGEIAKIAAGQKSQHRVPVRSSHYAGAAPRCPYRIEDVVLIERQAKEEDVGEFVFGVAITAIYRQTLDEITDEEAGLEGFDTADELRATFSASDVWVLTWEPCEVPRLLHRNPGGARTDYTHDARLALRGEGETVSDDELAHIRRKADENFAEHKRAERAELPTTTRMAELERAAQDGDHAAARQLRVIRQRIEAYERRREAA